MSMNFSAPPRRPRGESIVPMINVVFLLLIFFLMTSRLAPPEPFKVAPPTAGEASDPQGNDTLFVSSEGEIGFGDTRGEAAVAAFAAATRDADQAPQLRADAGVEAKTVARILKELAGAGLSNVALVVAPK